MFLFPRSDEVPFVIAKVDGKEIRALGTDGKSLGVAELEKRLAGWTGVVVMQAEFKVADKARTMFRYPGTLDPLNEAKKSSFKRVDPADAIAEARYRSDQKLPGVKILAMKNDDGEIVETFIYDEQPMAEVFEALKQLAGILSGAWFGMGYGFLSS